MSSILETSKRLYIISFTEGDRVTTIQKPLSGIEYDAGGPDLEYAHALMQDIDEVMNLYPGHTLYFQPNRDDSNSKGIVLRVR